MVKTFYVFLSSLLLVLSLVITRMYKLETSQILLCVSLSFLVLFITESLRRKNITILNFWQFVWSISIVSTHYIFFEYTDKISLGIFNFIRSIAPYFVVLALYRKDTPESISSIKFQLISCCFLFITIFFNDNSSLNYYFVIVFVLFILNQLAIRKVADERALRDSMTGFYFLSFIGFGTLFLISISDSSINSIDTGTEPILVCFIFSSLLIASYLFFQFGILSTSKLLTAAGISSVVPFSYLFDFIQGNVHWILVLQSILYFICVLLDNRPKRTTVENIR